MNTARRSRSQTCSLFSLRRRREGKDHEGQTSTALETAEGAESAEKERVDRKSLQRAKILNISSTDKTKTHSIAIVTMFETAPPIFNTTGTASPFGAADGIQMFT